MRLLRPSSEDEMIAVFLAGELESERFGAPIRSALDRDPRVVTDPNLDDPEENAYRRQLLATTRGWPNEGVFGGLPREIEWWRAALTPGEVSQILFIHWDWWLRVTNGTRRPATMHDLRRDDPDHAAHHRPIAERLASENPPPPMIVLKHPDDDKLVVLEGHVRLSAYTLFPELLPPELEVLLGVSPTIESWSEW